MMMAMAVMLVIVTVVVVTVNLARMGGGVEGHRAAVEEFGLWVDAVCSQSGSGNRSAVVILGTHVDAVGGVCACVFPCSRTRWVQFV